MRRFKATVCITKDGKVGEAYTGDRIFRDVEAEAYAKEISGYIEVPLSKGRSRQKGNGLEIEVARAFSTWLYGRDDVLKRTPLSGGWGSGKLGDITMDPAIAIELGIKCPPKIYVECKNREGVMDETFWRYLSTGSPMTIGDWIQDTLKKAEKLNQAPFIVMKGRGTEPFVFVPTVATKPIPGGGAVTHISLPIEANKKRPTLVRECYFFPLYYIGKVYTEQDITELRGY